MLELVFALLTILGPPLARLLAAAIDSWAKSVEAMNAPSSLPGTVEEIVRGVERNNLLSGLKLDSDGKRKQALDAAVGFVTNSGGTPNLASLNFMIEAAVQKLKGESLNETVAK